MVQTAYDVVTAGQPDAPAIGAPGRPWLTYAGLKKAGLFEPAQAA